MSSLQGCSVGVAAVLLFASAALATEPVPFAVVLASTASAYATGQVLDRSAVELPDGASATFLLPSGQLVTVKGPYAGILVAHVPASEASFAQFLVPEQDRSEIGGTRSLDAAATEETLTFDPGAGGVFCITPHTRVRLARPADPAFKALELAHSASGVTATLDWGASDLEPMAWPSALPLAGGTVTARSLSTHAERLIELHSIGRNGRSEPGLAAALALAGCREQATARLQRLRQALVPLDVYLASNRGRYPVYHAGEPVELVIRTNRDAYLYCLLRDVRGEVRLLFPPRPGQGHVASDRTLVLPGLWPGIGLQAEAGMKDSELRCVASERDLVGQVPQLTGAAGAAPLPQETVRALDAVTADPRQGQIVMTQLILRVED